jgi:hypothetical protein
LNISHGDSNADIIMIYDPYGMVSFLRSLSDLQGACDEQIACPKGGIERTVSFSNSGNPVQLTRAILPRTALHRIRSRG